MYAAPLVVEHESDGGIRGGTTKCKTRDTERFDE
jgi:hypothetical protein